MRNEMCKIDSQIDLYESNNTVPLRRWHGLEPVDDLNPRLARITVYRIKPVEVTVGIIFLVKEVLGVEVEINVLEFISDFGVHNLIGVP